MLQIIWNTINTLLFHAEKKKKKRAIPDTSSEPFPALTALIPRCRPMFTVKNKDCAIEHKTHTSLQHEGHTRVKESIIPIYI